MPRTTRSICTPAWLAAIERIDDAGIDERIELGPDLAGPAGPHMRDLLSICSSSCAFMIERRQRDLLQFLGLGIARDVVEEPRRIAARAPDRR